MSVKEEIKAYKEAVLAGEVKCASAECPECELAPDEFKVHERRRRWFYVIVGAFVERLVSMLVRWECPLCGRTFTQYPPFALPYKRYVRQTVETLSEKYVCEESCTYEESVKVNSQGIGYLPAGRHGGSQQLGVIDERQLAPSSVWRWLSFLGGLKETLRRALRLIRAKAPSSEVFRKAAAIAHYKYRSRERGDLLRRVLQLRYARHEYRRLFGRSFFPEYGTGGQWV